MVTSRFRASLFLATLLNSVALAFGEKQSLEDQGLSGDNPELKDLCRVELVAGQGALQPGSRIALALKLTIKPGWHTYWHSPRDGAAAPKVDWKLPEGFVASEVVWPVPHRQDDDGFISYTYEKTTYLVRQVEIPKSLDQPVRMSATGRIVVCREICIQVPFEVELTLKPADRAIPEKSPEAAAIAAVLKAAPERLARTANRYQRGPLAGYQFEQRLNEIEGSSPIWNVTFRRKPEASRSTPHLDSGLAISAFPFDLDYARIGEPEITRDGDELTLAFRIDLRDEPLERVQDKLRARLVLERVQAATSQPQSQTTQPQKPKQTREVGPHSVWSYELHYRGSP